jgi:hypothetical protein
MRRSSKYIIAWFVVFGVLSAVAMIPDAALMVLFLSAAVLPLPLFGLPGYLIIAAPTVLLYSIALLPVWLVLRVGRRRLPLIAAAACVPLVVAVGPGLLSQWAARQLATRGSNNDVSHAAAKPATIELAGDVIADLPLYGLKVGDEPAFCTEICRRLLFNGEAQWVRMTRIADPTMDRRSPQTRSATYRIERRPSCPQLYPAGIAIERAVRDRLAAGECLIMATAADAAPAARLTFMPRHSPDHSSSRLPDHAPILAIIDMVKELRIESSADGAPAPLERQTETVARTLAVPFYIGYEMHIGGSGYNGLTIGRQTIVVRPIDVAQALRDTFGYSLAEIAPPPPADPGAIVDRILAPPPESQPTLSVYQQDALHDVLAALQRQSSLSDADVDLVRRLIADDRVGDYDLGQLVQSLFRKHAARLEALVPVVIDRIGLRPPRGQASWWSGLGWTLTNFSADSLRPYRDKLVAFVEMEPDWPGNGVSTRLAELGGADAVNLVIRRLDSSSTRLSAAIAACRASTEAWPALEPAVLAHLTPPRVGNRLDDTEGALLLALVRFGKKPLAAEMIRKRDLINKTSTLERLEKVEPGFAPDRCRGWF